MQPPGGVVLPGRRRGSIPGMRSALTPLLVAGLAAAWCLAQALDSGLVAAVTAAVTLWAAAVPACRRRRPGSPLSLVLAGMVLVVGVSLVMPVLLPTSAPAVLVVQIGIALLLALLLPALYAATFDHEP